MSLLTRFRFTAGWIAGLVTAGLIGVAVGIFFLLGGYNTGANTQHAPLVAWVLHTTMINSIGRRAGSVQPPAQFTRADVLAGAQEYGAHCVVCHGGPAIPRQQWASALIPTPPYLLDARSRWSKAELYTIVHDGVKMTAMPSWGEVMRDRDIWNLVAFLEVLPSATPRGDPQLNAVIAPKNSTPQ